MANLCADVAALGFLGGPGVTPGRLLRVAHALTRVALMTLSGMSMSLRTSDAPLCFQLARWHAERTRWLDSFSDTLMTGARPFNRR